MFTLILVIVSILLTASVVLMSLHVSEQVYSTSASVAEVTTLLSQAQQLQLAAQTFMADYQRWPTDVAELASTGYLRQAPGFLGEEAYQPWATPVVGVPVYAQLQLNQEVCVKANELLKVSAQETLDVSKLLQCYGSAGSPREFKMVSTVGPKELAGVYATAEGLAALE